MDISAKLVNLTLGETRKCPRCGVLKNILEDFHKGASACKECRKLDYNEKKGPTVKNSDMLELVRELALKVEKMERAMKRHKIVLSDDEDEPVPKKVVKVEKDVGFWKEAPLKPKSKSDVDTGDDESDGEMLKRSEKLKKNKKVAENSDEEVDKPKEKTSKKVSKKPIGMPSDVKAMLAKRKK